MHLRQKPRGEITFASSPAELGRTDRLHTPLWAALPWLSSLPYRSWHQWEPNTMEPFRLMTPPQVPGSPRGREGLSVQGTDEHCLRKEIKAGMLIHIEIPVEEN